MKLDLYMRETCPFCRKVFAAIESMGRTDIEMHNIAASEEDMKTLVEVGGKSQVPCLFIDGKPMYESDDIIAFLEQNRE